jgi:hypothetical protein
MLRVHRVITRGIKKSIEHCEEFARTGPPNAAIREGFLIYLRAMAGVLDAHHLGEDEVTFPYFREKMHDAPYEKLMADHRTIVGVLERLERAASAVAESAGSSESLHSLHGVLGTLWSLWHPHIAIEETHWSPEAMAALMSEDENRELGQRIGENSQKHLHAPPVEIPFILYNLAPEDRETMAKAMPPVVTQQLVPLAWRAQWAPMKPFLLE